MGDELDAVPPLTEDAPTATEVVTPPLAKPKAPRTPAQLAALDAARQKAMQVRQEKAELSRKEKEVQRALSGREQKERADRIRADYEALSAPETEETPPDPPEPRRRKPARRIIVHEASSGEDDDDTVDVILPPKPKAPPPDPLARARQKMFEYQ